MAERPTSAPRSSPPVAPRASSINWWRLFSDYGPVLLMMAIIFLASTDLGAPAHSGPILGQILAWLGLAQRLSPEQVEVVHHYVRKAGHVTGYAILGVLMHRAAARGRERWSGRRVLALLAAAALYAATDEFHQRFVPTRGPSVGDVLLDTVGAALGLGLKWLGEAGWKRRRSG